jgi:hypothetical protein
MSAKSISMDGDSRSRYTAEKAGTNFDLLAEKLLAVDQSIIGTMLANSVGEILSVRSIPSAEPLRPSGELLKKSGPLLAIISSMIGQAEPPYGGCKSVIITFGKIKAVIIPGRTKRIIAVLVTTPDSSAEEISLKASQLVSN